MKRPTFARFVALAFAVSIFATSFASAQMSPAKVIAIDNTLQHVKASAAKLDARHQQMLDGYSNVLHIADVWHSMGMRLSTPAFAARQKGAPGVRKPLPAGVVAVSDPSTDLDFSSFGGFTQSETSVARCGNNVVVGFNDSGSVFETPFFFSGTGGQSFAGFSYSTDGGATFTDGGPTNPGQTDGNFMGGDPGVTCADANTFYYSEIFDTVDARGNFIAAIGINKSTDGGQTWADPVVAIGKDGFTHLLDKPWSTIDPTRGRIYVSYTDFDSSQTNGCGSNFPGRTAIEFVKSDDGGTTWSHPRVAVQACGNAAVQGSQMAVDSHGTLYISWVNLGSNFPFGPRQIQISSFKVKGQPPVVTVEANVQPGGDSYYLQGEFRDFLDMNMTIDRSGTASDGTIYIVWADGRDKIVPDVLGIQGAYAYDDILLRSSTDGGQTWGFSPLKVNTDIQARTGSGHDHYQAAAAVDKTGKVAVCWYDRREDPEDFAISRYCGESTNGGFNWTSVNLGTSPFAPTHGNDIFINPIYMGDYDVLTTDFTGANAGFIGAFELQGAQGNPDAFANSMQ
jgi:hypothetical protein